MCASTADQGARITPTDVDQDTRIPPKARAIRRWNNTTASAMQLP